MKLTDVLFEDEKSKELWNEVVLKEGSKVVTKKATIEDQKKMIDDYKEFIKSDNQTEKKLDEGLGTKA